ncbi:MAG: hypothetical protein IJR88_04130 [Clostridia bacterium]|nr:hypothetical protein [Clostridia bacterium]
MKEEEKDAYFAASNSKNGFCSYFEECFRRPGIGHLYLIKGGPGTGKSQFMRVCAKKAAENEFSVEYILCSSDPESLDGVILTKGERCIAFCDATAPHVMEAREPGLSEEIINLGQFWDADALQDCKVELRRLEKEKKKAYLSAYRYLSAAGELYLEELDLVSPFWKTEELNKLVEKFAKEIKTGPGYSSRPSVLSAVSMDGRVSLNSFFAKADVRYFVEDCHGISARFLAEVGKIAVERNQPIRVSYDPLVPGRIDGIYFSEAGIALQTAGDPTLYPAKKIRLRRCVDVASMRGKRGQIRYAAQMKRALTGGALESLARVKEAHFAMEKIYSSAMDFPAKEAFTEAFLNKLFEKE